MPFSSLGVYMQESGQFVYNNASAPIFAPPSPSISTITGIPTQPPAPHEDPHRHEYCITSWNCRKRGPVKNKIVKLNSTPRRRCSTAAGSSSSSSSSSSGNSHCPQAANQSHNEDLQKTAVGNAALNSYNPPRASCFEPAPTQFHARVGESPMLNNARAEFDVTPMATPPKVAATDCTEIAPAQDQCGTFTLAFVIQLVNDLVHQRDELQTTVHQERTKISSFQEQVNALTARVTELTQRNQSLEEHRQLLFSQILQISVLALDPPLNSCQ